jgi:hypothetical protein
MRVVRSSASVHAELDDLYISMRVVDTRAGRTESAFGSLKLRNVSRPA